MKINGTTIHLMDNLSLEKFLKNKDYDGRPIVVEYNGKVIRKSTFKDIILKDEDRLEIVSLVAGG